MRKMSFKNKFFSIQAIDGLMKFLFKAIPMLLLSGILKSKLKYRELWIITERPGEARDNGYHLFKYIRQNYSNDNCFYIIEKNSKDLPKVQKYGNIVYFGSLKHYLYYYLANRHITAFSQGYGCMPNVYACRLMELIYPLKSKKIYLKHGIIKDYIERLTKEKSNLDLVVCGAQPEYQYIRDNFGYDNNEVQYLGLARFDELLKESVPKKQIMYMPTWRRWLKNLDTNEFMGSEYYKNIQSLINNKDLMKVLKDNKSKLVLCLHPVTQSYRHLFNSNPNVDIVNTRYNDIQKLLIDSSLLITDYSSVYFDFAFMKKPIIYYQFDHEKFKENHYSEGYFNYFEDGFGPVIKTEKDLIKTISKVVLNNYKMNKKYVEKINYYFPIRDTNNCFRNYQAIKEL